MSVEDKVQAHFHADARRFDAIYEDSKNPLTRFIDHVWRGVVRRRLELTIERLQPLAGKTILDVGCGSGRFCIAYVQHGAAHVLGVDFAPAMIDLAKDLARSAGVLDRCDFRVGAFPEAIPEPAFDVSTALGFFDYIPDAARLIAAMRAKTTGTMVMSFPKAREWRAPIRRLRFRLLGCPLFLYTESEMRRLLQEAGVARYEVIELDRDYLVIAAP